MLYAALNKSQEAIINLDPIKITREVTSYAFRKTGLARLAQTAIHCTKPEQHVNYLQGAETERQWRREAKILQGVGELELQVQKGLIELDETTRTNMWEAAKSGTAGVKLSDVFDKHMAELLESTTPDGPEMTSE